MMKMVINMKQFLFTHNLTKFIKNKQNFSGGTRIGGIRIPPPIKPYCSTLSKGPRLMITYIENTFFKSYAGTVKVGPFHHVRSFSHLKS